ncbi:DUF2569 family protein [Ignatzschineria rhizosphaerae]|uniref:DUF2569 family protein n=1 Tax=Ignatzschineria rhizosphaerae TaxID=2923279 RepID=UPI003D81990C
MSEIAGNTLFICAFIYALLLFYNQKRLFPKVRLILVITYPIFMTLNILMSHWMMENLIQSDYKRLSLMLLLNIAIYLIWVPYLYYSQRVKSTFRY